MTWQSHITSDPDVLAGEPVVRGTRLAVDFLLGLFAAGWTLEQVHASYPQLTPEALRATWTEVVSCWRAEPTWAALRGATDVCRETALRRTGKFPTISCPRTK